ncbi:hypothetical protein ACFX16_013894 [Malus domestica]
MVVQTLDAKRDPFSPKEDEEEILEPEVPHLSAIGALLYLTQCIRADISFSVNLLARYNNAPKCRHWNGVKDIFRYLKDAGYLFNPHIARSQQVMSLPLETPLYLGSLPRKRKLRLRLTMLRFSPYMKHRDNLADLFTKLLPKSTFQKPIQGIDMRKLSKLHRL